MDAISKISTIQPLKFFSPTMDTFGNVMMTRFTNSEIWRSSVKYFEKIITDLLPIVNKNGK